ncbi:MAG: hypothetical protein ACI9Z3_002053, partial [Roseivirga sp.]
GVIDESIDALKRIITGLSFNRDYLRMYLLRVPEA